MLGFVELAACSHNIAFQWLKNCYENKICIKLLSKNS